MRFRTIARLPDLGRRWRGQRTARPRGRRRSCIDGDRGDGGRFLVVFGSFALILAPFTASIQRYLPFVAVVIAAVLLVLGGWMLTGREVTLLLPKSRRGAPTARLGSMFGYGVGYAVASLSCTIGPFLAVTGTTFRTGSILNGIIAYPAYAAGMALLVGVLAFAIAIALAAVTLRTQSSKPPRASSRRYRRGWAQSAYCPSCWF